MHFSLANGFELGLGPVGVLAGSSDGRDVGLEIGADGYNGSMVIHIAAVLADHGVLDNDGLIG